MFFSAEFQSNQHAKLVQKVLINPRTRMSLRPTLWTINYGVYKATHSLIGSRFYNEIETNFKNF